ncbi:MAG: hypothetical protein ACLSCU_08250 [Eubacterium sp.]
MEQQGKLKAVITQNIDGRIRKQEVKKYWNFTEVFSNYCTRCGKFYSLEDLVPEDVPKCDVAA